jgi:hypothetical protein
MPKLDREIAKAKAYSLGVKLGAMLEARDVEELDTVLHSNILLRFAVCRGMKNGLESTAGVGK